MNSFECLRAIQKVLDEGEPDDPQVGEGIDLYKIGDLVAEWEPHLSMDLKMARLLLISAAKCRYSDAVMKWIADNRGPQGKLPVNEGGTLKGFPDYESILLALLKDEEL